MRPNDNQSKPKANIIMTNAKKIRLIVNPKYEGNTALMGFLRALPDTFAGEGTILWNKRNQIRRFTVAGVGEMSGDAADAGDASTDGSGSLTLVVKKYKRPNVFQKIGALFSHTKAEKAYRNGLELSRRGFLTPEPVACLEIKGAVFIKEAYLVTLNTDWPPIADELDRPDWNKSLATAFAQFAARLHEQGVLHNDLNKTNVLYNKVGADAYRFQLIDNNRMRFLPQVSMSTDKGQAPSQKYQTPSDRDCMENLTRFTGNLALFSFVAEAYACARGLDADLWSCRALRQKRRHDRRWRLKKAFAHPIRTLKRKRK